MSKVRPVGDFDSYVEGLRDAAIIAKQRYQDLAWCNKKDKCHKSSRGAELVLDDIEFEIKQLVSA